MKIKQLVILTTLLIPTLVLLLFLFLAKQNETKDTLNMKDGSFILNYQDGDILTAKLGNEIIELEVARSEAKKQRGLMFRESLEENNGMIFIYPTARPLQFWMKDTLISLDIIFFDTEHKIVNIHENTKVNQTEERYFSVRPSLFVVELNGGWTSKNNIKMGDKIEFIQK